MFFGPSALQLRCKIDKKASTDRSKIKEKCCQHLDANFDRFGSQLGSILGGFWRPSWTQVGTKWQQNPIPPPIKNMITVEKASGRILKGFWSQLGSNLDHLGLHPAADVGSLGAPSAGLCTQGSPRPPQDPPKTPQDPPKTSPRHPKTPQKPPQDLQKCFNNHPKSLPEPNTRVAAT